MYSMKYFEVFLSMINIMFIILYFLVIGTIFIRGKGASLIAGYNTMSEEEKATYDEVKLAKFMGKIMYLLSFWMLFWVASEFFDENSLLIIGFVLFVGTVLFAVIYVNSSEKFKRSEEHTSELQSRGHLVCR